MIAHYRVLEPLGEGGMGTVYRARDERLGREVAVKVLKRHDDAQAVDRFFREARAASALNHPNIVTVFDAGEAAQGHFIVMELVRGRGLRTLIGQPLEHTRFLNLTRQMAEALAVAHDADIVHRDMKPENIMVREDGYVKVLDFGLARLNRRLGLTSTSQTTTATEPRTLVGTIKYMSPEQATGRPASTASDVFSLGVVLYELATGQHPFEAESVYGILHAIVAHNPASPSRLNVELSGRLEELLLRMLAKDPNLRPSAADTVAAVTVPESATRLGAASAAAVISRRQSVGRLKPRAELRAALEHVGRGSGLVVCVSGEAGIGKSTLVEDFLADVAAGGECHVARGRCSERLAGTEAYLPLLDALEDLVRDEDGALARLMRTVAPLWYVQIAPATAQDLQAGRLGDETRTGTQERLKRELAAFFAEACRQRRIVFFFDDLHWVDLSTIDMLGYLTRHFESLPVLIIVAYRPEELLVQKHPFLSTKRNLQSRGFCRDVALEFLTREEVQQYVALRFPKHRFPRGFIDLIYGKTEGNPLFVVDVLTYLSDQSVVSRQDEEWTLTRSVPDIARELPESVRGMIQRKIDLFSESDLRVLLAASVQGYQFDAAVVAKVIGVDSAEIEEQLDALDRVNGFVRRVREQELPDGTLTLRYRFVHVLYQNSLYASLTPARKTLLSRAVAKALEQFHRDNAASIASELAALYEAAREFSVATDYFRIAAKKAVDVFAYEEAFMLGRRALDCLAPLPDSPERRRRELLILVTMGVPASASRGFSSPEVQEVYDRARTLCLELNETEPLARVLYGQVSLNIVRLQLDSAEEAVNRLDVLARDSQDPALAVHAINGLALVSYYRGDFQPAVAQFRRLEACCSLDERRSVRAIFGYDPTSAAHFYLGWSLWCLGYPDGAVQEVEAGLRSAVEVAHPYSLALSLVFACGVHLWRGDWQALKTHNDRMVALAKEGGFSYFVATGVFVDGLCQVADGRREEGLALMREGIETLRAIEGRTSVRRFAGEYAEQLALAGKLDEGLELLSGEIETMRADRYWEAELFRVKGELLLGRGSGVEAEQCFERAISVARVQRAKSLELRAATSLARFWHAGGQSQRAAALLSGIYHGFTEGFDTADLERARRLLSDVGVNVE